jgi:hypothetical protein
LAAFALCFAQGCASEDDSLATTQAAPDGGSGTEASSPPPEAGPSITPPAVDAEPPTCGAVVLQAKPVPANVLVVFDQSNSMNLPFQGGRLSKPAMGVSAASTASPSTSARSPTLGDDGYNTQNMILLSDMHAGWGDVLFEEAWAHELAHLFWGETVTPHDAPRTGVSSEGMAVLLQHDYGVAKHHAGEDRDLVLARRNREAELLSRYVVSALPPLVTESTSQAKRSPASTSTSSRAATPTSTARSPISTSTLLPLKSATQR